LDDFVHRLRSLHEELDDEEIREKYLGWLILTVTVFPTLDVQSDIFKSVSNICAGSFQIDDAIDDAEAMEDLKIGLDSIYKRYPVWKRIFDGEYEAWNEIALAHPVMAVAIQFYIEAFDVFCQHVPNFRKIIAPFQKAVFRGAEAIPLLPNNYTEDANTFSEQAFKKVREADAGGQLFVEASAALASVTLPPHVRQSLLFKIFINGFNLCAGLFNDIFGLKKDVKNNSTNLTCILRRVIREGISLRESFDQTAKLLRDTTRDVRFTGKMLLETFPAEKSVKDFVQIAERAFDGQVYAYFMLFQLGNRYGETLIEILPDN